MGATPVFSAVARRCASAMMAESFTPQFPVALIEKDFGYFIEAVESGAAPMIAAARQVFSDAIEQGLGELNMTSVVTLYKPGRPNAE